jgi:hypothetical protein
MIGAREPGIEKEREIIRLLIDNDQLKAKEIVEMLAKRGITVTLPNAKKVRSIVRPTLDELRRSGRL